LNPKTERNLIMNRNGWLLLGGIALSAMARAETKPFDFGPWAPGASPAEIGKRLAEHFVASPHLHRNADDQFVVYPEVCTWYGALTYAQLADDRDLTRRLVARFEPLFEPENAWLIPPVNHVDACVFGALPLEIYMQTHRYPYRVVGLAIADGVAHVEGLGALECGQQFGFVEKEDVVALGDDAVPGEPFAEFEQDEPGDPDAAIDLIAQVLADAGPELGALEQEVECRAFDRIAQTPAALIGKLLALQGALPLFRDRVQLIARIEKPAHDLKYEVRLVAPAGFTDIEFAPAMMAAAEHQVIPAPQEFVAQFGRPEFWAQLSPRRPGCDERFQFGTRPGDVG